MSNDSLKQVATEATAGWYHTLCQALDLNPGTFQLSQGQGTPFGTDSNYLWTVADTIPPYSAVNVWGSSRSAFSSGYDQILMSLQDPPDSQFQRDLRDNYNLWEQFIKSYTWNSGDTYVSVFKDWAARYYPPNQIDELVQELTEDTPITSARALWDRVGTGGTKAYSLTYEMVADRIRTAPAIKVSYNSAQATRTFSDTWANGSADVWIDIFGAAGGASYEQTSLRTFSGSIDIQMSLAHVLTVEVLPLSEQSNDPYLSGYKPWYDSGVIDDAYGNKDNHDEIWNTQGETDWADAFGTTGFLRYMTTGLVIVDGVHMTMTVQAAFDEQDTKNITANYEAGLWPFFYSQGQAGYSYSHMSADSSGFSVTVDSGEGNYLILGADVADAATALGS